MYPYEFDAERFSRWVSYVLRHNPARYGLRPDRHGYVDAEEFFQIARRRYPGVSLERLRELILGGGVDRFELAGSRLRARYGHSIPVEPAGEPVVPPARLYHGTEAAQAPRILAEGLGPTARRFVHLSETLEDAVTVSRRNTEAPQVLRIDAAAAHAAGVAFYREGRVYLTTGVPAQFLSLEPDVPAPAPAA